MQLHRNDPMPINPRWYLSPEALNSGASLNARFFVFRRFPSCITTGNHFFLKITISSPESNFFFEW
jgi:hypothetical protein